MTNILGVRIDTVSKEQALEKILNLATHLEHSYVVTINPEQLYDAYYNSNFKDILNCSDLNLCDGVGVKLASFLFPPVIKDIVAGSGILKDVLQNAVAKKNKVLVLITANALSSKEKIEKYLIEYLEMSKEHVLVIKTTEVSSKSVVNAITLFKPNITFLSHNHILANDLIHQMGTMGVTGVKINVGGSFDYLLGLRKSPPKIFKYFGIEWLYRLVNEPAYRYKRVFKATILFPLLVLSTKIRLTYSNIKE